MSSEAKNKLTQQEAAERATKVCDVKYKLTLVLGKGADYEGDAVITFTNKAPGSEIFLDFVSKTIHKVVVNGQAIEEKVYWDSRLHLQAQWLTAGVNTVNVTYTNAHDTTGNGFHRFVDPEDKEVYLYTNFEPFECHRMLPCFDQPNIKGKLALSVTAPAEWKVVANSIEEKSSTDLGLTVHSYRETPKLSTYLYCVVAGPFECEKDAYADGRIPLGLYCRRSLFKYLDVKALFDLTKRGLKFFEGFFNYQYPFAKYDQVFCPEFNVGAMENAGCVTFTERYLFRVTPTRPRLLGRANTFLHEMSHMWFGDLTTCDWWDSLWLNESFATYMAALAVSSIPDFGQQSWQNFHFREKMWALREDQLSTTHPVQGVVPDTDVACQIFDGITYGKGAALLKQLVYLVGLSAFQIGMQHYFRKFEWKNTNIHDLLEALAFGATRSGLPGVLDPVSWSAAFLETSGVNTLVPRVTYSPDGNIETFSIEQLNEPFRAHHTEVVFVSLNSSQMPYVAHTFKAELGAQKSTQFPGVEGMRRPAFVYLNYNDHAYAKCTLDNESVVFLFEHMPQFTEPLLRQQLWCELVQMVRDGALRPTYLLDLVVNALPQSVGADAQLLSYMMSYVMNISKNFVPEQMVATECAKLFDMCKQQALAAELEQFQSSWVSAMLTFAWRLSRERVAELVPLLDGRALGNWPLNQEQRWQLVRMAVAFGVDKAHELLAEELKRDPSDVGKLEQIACGSLVPDPAVKAKAWERFLDKNTQLSSHEMAADLSGFSAWPQRRLTEAYDDQFFDVVRTVFRERNREFASDFFENLCPFRPASTALLTRAEALLAQLDRSEESLLTRHLQEHIDDLKRVRRVQATVANPKLALPSLEAKRGTPFTFDWTHPLVFAGALCAALLVIGVVLLVKRRR